MMAVGIYYRLDCPAEFYIPVYLIMSGIVSILTIAWLIVTQLDDRFVTQLDFYVKLHRIQWFLISLLFIWCILGSYFVFRISFPKEIECVTILYGFSFFVVCAQIVFFVHLIVYCLCTRCGCTKYCCNRTLETEAETEGGVPVAETNV